MNGTISQARLKEILHYNADTGIFTWNLPRIGISKNTVAGTVGKRGYARISINGNRNYAHRLAWFYIYGYLPEGEIDHIDRNRINNKISNLREVSRACNERNKDISKGNTSGVKGISWAKLRRKWVAQIKVDGRGFFLGRYNKFHNAVCARLAAEQCLDWQGCDSNSSAFRYFSDHIKSIN